jgi:hypothetical protein
MTVREIIKIAATILQKEDLCGYIGGGEETGELKKDLDRFFECYKLIIGELCEECLPTETSENFVSQGGKVNFADFSKTPLEIKKCYENGKEIGFKVFPTFLQTNAENVTVVYSFYPQFDTLDDDCPYSESQLSARIIALGVAREYLLLGGLYEEAVLFDERFKDALATVVLKKNVGKIKARRWF